MGFFDKIKKALMGKEESEAVTPKETENDQEQVESEKESAEKTAVTEESTPAEPAEATPEIEDNLTSDTVDLEIPADTASVSPEEETKEQLENSLSEENVSRETFPEPLPGVNPTPEDVTLENLQKSLEKEVVEPTEPAKSVELPPAIDTPAPELSESPETTEGAEVSEPEVTEALVTEIASEKQEITEKYDQGLKKSRKTFGQRLNELFANFRSVDEDFFEEVEETLIGADVGFDAAMRIADEMRQEVKLKNVKKPKEVQNVIIEKLVNLYDEAGEGENHALNIQENDLTVMLFVGVNGVGKTTSIGKLAYEYRMAGKKVLMAAADTFRAGAIDQLVVWGERSGVEVVRHNAGGDPAAVVFDAVKKAKEEHYDILLVDTAGRLQNKVNLMKELDKIKRVIQREVPTAPHEVLLVVDATTGQNAMVQAKQFKETTDVSGIVLTKLDGTAKGGIVLAIRNELHLPVKLVGLGEGIDDLEVFDPNQFVIGLFKGLIQS